MAIELGPGARVGAYVLEVRLGGGSFGSVWRATHTATGDVVAVKLLTGAQATGDRAAIRAEVELLAGTASSQSSHVVRVLGGGADPVPHIVMEYVDGTDLAAALAERGTLPLNEVVDVGMAIADALEALYEAGIIHRDVKPANVLIDRHHVVKLADFGIAKIVGLETITMTGQLPMTMAYAAPEAWEGAASHQSDLYSLGIVLYQCLVGATPFSGNYGALYKAHTSAPPDLDRLPPETPPSLREVIRRCLEKDAAARPKDAAAALAMLQQAAAELTAPPAPEPLRFGPWIRRAPHPTQPWAWRCAHELTGETATVEVHSFATAGEGERLRAAVAANARLVPFGAERLLGTNRLVLRPDEGWRLPPAGDFHFWIARDEQPPAPPPAEVSIPRLRRAVEALQSLIAVATEERVALSLAAPNVAALQDGAIHVRRIGLVADDDPSVSAMTFLRTLPLDEDARLVVERSSNLDDLRAQLSGPTAGIGVARVPDEHAVVADGGGSTILHAASVVPGDRSGRWVAPSERAPSGEGGSYPPDQTAAWSADEPPRRLLFGLGAAAAVLIGVLAVSAFLVFGRGSSSANDGAGATPQLGQIVPGDATRLPASETPTIDAAHLWFHCATQIARNEPDELCNTPMPSPSPLQADDIVVPGNGAVPPAGGVGGDHSSPATPPTPSGSSDAPPAVPPASTPFARSATPAPTTALPKSPTMRPPTKTPTPTFTPTPPPPPPPSPQLIVVDDLDGGFSRGGPGGPCPAPGADDRNWNWCWETAGYNGVPPYSGHYWYTWNNSGSADQNWGQWVASLTAAATYRVCAYVPPNHAYTHSARYVIHHANGATLVTLNQQLYAGWVDLGVYSFNAGSGGYVYLGDATGEGWATMQIGYDAMKWVPNGGGC